MANCVILAISYPHTRTVTITDNASNTWPAATVTKDNGVGNTISAVYILPSPAAASKLTIAFNATVNWFQYTLSEWGNVAAASPVDTSGGTAGNAGTTSGSNTTYNPGSITTTSSGDLIFNYFGLGFGGPANAFVTKWVPGGSYILLDGDTAWQNTGNGNGGFPHASQYFIQTSAGTINSTSMTTDGNGGAGDTYNTLVVALKASGGTPFLVQHVSSASNFTGCNSGSSLPGNTFVCPTIVPFGQTPSGMWLYKILHFSTTNTNAATSVTFQIPCVGNLRVLETPGGQNTNPITTIVDSDSVTWTRKVGEVTDNIAPQIAYRDGNLSGNSAATVTVTCSSSPQFASYRFFDYAGAATSAFDVVTGVANTGESSPFSMGSITPTASGTVIASLGLTQGPGRSVTAPASANFDLCQYAGEIDPDVMENADLLAHLFHTGSSTFNFSWTMDNSTNVACTVIAFKAAVVGDTLGVAMKMMMM